MSDLDDLIREIEQKGMGKKKNGLKPSMMATKDKIQREAKPKNNSDANDLDELILGL